jgi:hypothetical protein
MANAKSARDNAEGVRSLPFAVNISKLLNRSFVVRCAPSNLVRTAYIAVLTRTP